MPQNKTKPCDACRSKSQAQKKKPKKSKKENVKPSKVNAKDQKNPHCQS